MLLELTPSANGSHPLTFVSVISDCPDDSGKMQAGS